MHFSGLTKSFSSVTMFRRRVIVTMLLVVFIIPAAQLGIGILYDHYAPQSIPSPTLGWVAKTDAIEEVSLRTLKSKTFRSTDGQLSTVFTTTPIHAQLADGSMIDLIHAVRKPDGGYRLARIDAADVEQKWDQARAWLAISNPIAYAITDTTYTDDGSTNGVVFNFFGCESPGGNGYKLRRNGGTVSTSLDDNSSIHFDWGTDTLPDTAVMTSSPTLEFDLAAEPILGNTSVGLAVEFKDDDSVFEASDSQEDYGSSCTTADYENSSNDLSSDLSFSVTTINNTWDNNDTISSTISMTPDLTNSTVITGYWETGGVGMSGLLNEVAIDSGTTGTGPRLIVHYTTDANDNAPTFTVNPSDGGSTITAGNSVTFTATATDTESDQYYLAVCKTNSITAGDNAAPTCITTGSTYGISSATSSGSQASVSYTTTSSDIGTNAWYAFVCDKHATEGNVTALCSSVSQGSGSTGSGFTVQGNTISGTVYTDEGTTNIGSGKTVKMLINGITGYTTSSTTTTDSSGAFSFTLDSSFYSASLSNPMVTAFIDGATQDGVTVAKMNGSGSTITGFNIYQDRLIVRNETSGNVSRTNLDTANDGDADITSIYNNGTSTLTIPSGKELYVWSGDTFAPAAATNINGSLDIRGTFTGSTFTHSVAETFENQGTFTGSGTLAFDGSSAQTVRMGALLVLSPVLCL